MSQVGGRVLDVFWRTCGLRMAPAGKMLWRTAAWRRAVASDSRWLVHQADEQVVEPLRVEVEVYFDLLLA